MRRLTAFGSYMLRQHRHLVRPIYLIRSPLKNALPSPSQISTLIIPSAAFLSSPNSITFRTFSDDAGLPANIVLVKSEDQLKKSLDKVKDESSPAIFYFTALWCGPCRLVWPEIEKLSKSLPDVKFYKIDIDEVGGGSTLSKLNICSVPTFHFFKDGKKAAEVVGADSRRIKDVSSELYKSDD